MNDSTSIVRVTRYFKEVGGRDPVSNVPTVYQVQLDWGIGRVDDGAEGYYIYGSPYQLFASIGQGGIYGDPTTDSRVLVQNERMSLSSLASPGPGISADEVHFKNPGI